MLPGCSGCEKTNSKQAASGDKARAAAARACSLGAALPGEGGGRGPHRAGGIACFCQGEAEDLPVAEVVASCRQAPGCGGRGRRCGCGKRGGCG